MAEKFHINSKGEPGKCSAQHGGCPFGNESDHYATKEGASAAFERSMTEGVVLTLTKAPTRKQVDQVLDSMDRGSDEIPEGVEFVDITPEAEVSASPKTPVENLKSAIQDEIKWCDEALNDVRLRVSPKMSEAHGTPVVTDSDHEPQRPKTDFELRQEQEREDYYREQTAKRIKALYGEDNAENAIDAEIREIEEYKSSLREDLSKVGKSWPVVTELRETLRERRLKKELNDLQYKYSDGTPSLKELEEKVNWPIRERDETSAEFKARIENAASQENEYSAALAQKHEEESRIKAELDMEEQKRLESLIANAAWRHPKDDALLIKASLYMQDEENLENYNSFANRASRLFKKRDILTDRARLEALPADRKLISYDPSNNNKIVWTKMGHNRWESENGMVITDDEIRIPATIVK